MRPLGMRSVSLATPLKVPIRDISAIVNERRRVSAEMAMRLERYLEMSAEFWMNAQMNYDLETAKDNSLAAIRREVRPAPRDLKNGEPKRVSGGAVL